jgi:Co/Zn/Cd efflux system component
MELVAFLIIVGVWAVFLLPSFFESQRNASLRSTRHFARNNDLLASVALQSTEAVRAASRARRRRRSAVSVLGTGALGSLAAAVLTGSTIWLGVTILFDVLLSVFVTALLQAKAARFAPVAKVVPLESAPAYQQEDISEIEIVPTVRIVAG